MVVELHLDQEGKTDSNKIRTCTEKRAQNFGGNYYMKMLKAWCFEWKEKGVCLEAEPHQTKHYTEYTISPPRSNYHQPVQRSNNPINCTQDLYFSHMESERK